MTVCVQIAVIYAESHTFWFLDTKSNVLKILIITQKNNNSENQFIMIPVCGIPFGQHQLELEER